MSKIQIEVDENEVAVGYNPSKVTYKQLGIAEGYRLLPERFYGIPWLKVGYHCPYCIEWHSATANRRYLITGEIRTLRTKASDEELTFIAAHKNIRVLTTAELGQLRKGDSKVGKHADYNNDHKLYFGRKTSDGDYKWGSEEPGAYYTFGGMGGMYTEAYYTTLTPAELQAILKKWNPEPEKTWRKMTPIEVIACYNARKLAEAEKKSDNFFGFNTAEFTFGNPEHKTKADFSARAEHYCTTLTPEELLRKLGYR